MIILALLAFMAHAAEVHVVRSGETIESIAEDLGDPALAAVLRGENGLAPGAQPVVGTVLRLPPLPGHADHDALVLSIAGTGTASIPGVGPVPLARGRRLPVGTTACTDPESFATIRLAVDPATGDHDDVNLLPSTCVQVVAASSRGGARASTLQVEAGGIEVRAADASPGEITVLTEAGVTTGAGGGFRVALEDTGAARTEALDNPVAVIGAGVEKAMDAGQGSRTLPGEAPSDPVDLLPPGRPERPEEGAPLLRPDFTWTEVPEALGYRLQIATAPDFSEIVFATEVPRPVFQADGLYLPYRVPGLWWRVTSFDLTGFEGPPSAPRRVDVPDGVGP